MKKIVKVALLSMAVLTVTYVSLVAYAYANSSHCSAGSSDEGKHPIEYGIWKSYLAEKLETGPQEWNTTEELGIIFGDKMEYAETETYLILIVDEEKALPWMRDDEQPAVKYEGEFYRIVWLWVTPGLPESVKQWQLPIGVALGAGWVFTGASFIRERRAK